MLIGRLTMNSAVDRAGFYLDGEPMAVDSELYERIRGLPHRPIGDAEHDFGEVEIDDTGVRQHQWKV